MERIEYTMEFKDFTITCYSEEEVERFARAVAPSRAHKAGTTALEEFEKIIAKVLTGNGDTYSIRERATQGATR